MWWWKSGCEIFLLLVLLPSLWISRWVAFWMYLMIWFFVLVEKTSSLGLPKRSSNACCVANPFGSQQGWMQKDSSKIGYAFHFLCFMPPWYFSLFVWIMAVCRDDIFLATLEILERYCSRLTHCYFPSAYRSALYIVGAWIIIIITTKNSWGILGYSEFFTFVFNPQTKKGGIFLFFVPIL